jgi:ferritin-like metal-binding protein YciE
MSPSQLTQLLTFALAAMKTGSQIAAEARADIRQAAQHPHLQALLDQEAATAQQWGIRLDRALAEVGGAPAPVNHVMTTHYEVDQRIRQFTAADPAVRDLSIIASGQRALHYWLSFFDSARAYAAQAGLVQTAQDLQASHDEARQADAHYARLTAQLLGAQ